LAIVTHLYEILIGGFPTDRMPVGRGLFGDEKTEALGFDLGAIARGDAHFGHEGAGDRGGAIEEVAPVELIELEDAVVEGC
jgi:hypothetical protein